MKDNLKIILLMDTVILYGLMGRNLKVFGRIIEFMEKVILSGVMVENMMENM